MGAHLDVVDMTQRTDKWLAFINTVRNLRLPQNAGNLLTR